MRYQHSEGREAPVLSEFNDRVEISLEEVVVSPIQSSSTSSFKMHGALEDTEMDSSEAVPPTSPNQNSSTNFVLQDSDIEGQTEQMNTGGSEERVLGLALVDPQHEPVVGRHQTFPARQDTASCTGTSALAETAFSRTDRLSRRVTTK